MKNAQHKDFFREIRRSLNRYLSILFIVALGVAFFSGVRSAEPDMRLSVDAVADKANFMDLRILSTMGLTKEDLEAIRNVPGITAAEGEFSVDVLSDYREKELVLHVASVTEQVSLPTVKEGRLPEKEGECLIDDQLLMVADYKLGGEITFRSGTDDPLSDTLKRDTYTIVGIGTSPYYLNFNKGTAAIGNGDVRGFVLVRPEEFELEFYTQIYAAADGLDGYITAGTRYTEEAGRIKEAVEAIADGQCRARLDGIKDEAEAEIAEAEEELSEKQAEAEEELSGAWQEILDGEQELSDAREEIQENERKLEDGKAAIQENERKLADAKRELASGETEITAGKAELCESGKKLESGKAELSARQAELAAGEEALNSAKQEYEAGAAQAAAGRAALEASRAELDNRAAALEALRAQLLAAGLDPEENAEYTAGRQAVQAAEQTLTVRFEELSRQEAELSAAADMISGKETELSAGKAALQEAQTEIETGEAVLKMGWQKIYAAEAAAEAARTEIADGEEQLASARREIEDGEEKLADGRKELADGEQTLADAKQEYADAKAEADEKIADARAEIDDARAELEDLELPEWYVLGRDSVQSYVEFDNDADRIGAIGKVFPVVFFLVAALVSLTTMTRMVEEKRTEIGTMKALGYSTLSIASKYIGYAVSASLIGSILGFLTGEKLLPWVIITTYKILYGNLTIIKIPYNWSYALGAAAIAVLCTAGATYAACWKAALSQPAALMRPVAPMKGKKILLERVKPLWKRLNFSQKSTLRNLLRYKKRLLMTVFGIGACMALIIVGFGLRDSIYAVSDRQYGGIWCYDVITGVDTDSSGEEKEALQTALLEHENVEEAMAAHTAVMDGEANGVTKQVNLVVPEDMTEFPDFFVLCDRVSGERYTLDDNGVVINEKLAKLLNIREGDSLLLKESDTESVSVTVSHIVENYVYNYVYLSPGLYKELYGKDAEYDVEYIRLLENGEEKERELATVLLDVPSVTGVTLVSDMNKTILDMLGSLDTVVWVLIISAGLLAFVVVYNLNNINITERKRELATIKLLGFYDMELAAYVYRENVLLTLIGILTGVFMGNLLHRFVIETVEVDLIMFGRTVHPASYLWGAGLTLLFAFLVNVTMFYKLRRIDMVESLKSVE